MFQSLAYLEVRVKRVKIIGYPSRLACITVNSQWTWFQCDIIAIVVIPTVDVHC